MSFNISYVFQAIDNFSEVSQKIGNQMETLKKKSLSVAETFGHIGEKLEQIGTKLSIGAGLPIAAFGAMALDAAAEQEKISAQIQNIVGDTKKAMELTEKLKQIKMTSPIDTSKIEDSALRLLVMGMSVDKVGDTIQRFSAIAAGSGESVENLVETFSIAQSGPEGMSRALMMLGRKIPILQELQKIFSEKFDLDLSTKEIKKLAADGRIDISVLQLALKNMTDQGGKFFGAMDKQSNTFSGSMQLLKNNFHEFLEEIGDSILKSADLVGVIHMVSDALKTAGHFVAEFAKNHPVISKYIVIFLAIATAIGPVLLTLGLLISGIGSLINIFTIFLNPTFVGINLIFKLALAFLYLYNRFEIVKKVTDSLVSSIASFISAFPILSQAVIFAAGAVFMLWRANLLASASAVIFRGVMAALPAILALARGAMLLLNAAFAMNPIGLVVIAIGALAAGVVYLLDKFGILDKMLGWIKDKATSLAQELNNLFNINIGAKIDAIKGSFSEGIGNIGAKFTNFFTHEQPAPLIAGNVQPNIATNQNSKSSIDINIKGNTGVVESVKSKTDKNTNLKVTQNMAYGGY